MSTGKVPSRAESILSFEDARASVLQHAEAARRQPLQREQAPLLGALGRTLAEEIIADRDFPPFRRAARDGYAVRSDDLRNAPCELHIVGEIRAGGALPSGFSRLEQGQALSIMTGAPAPDGADAVVMVEHTERRGERVHVRKSVATGENIVPRGSEGRAGAVLVERGTRISFPQIALAAAVGKLNLDVWVRPRVAILPTGDEVIPITGRPAENQIRNSNSFSLAAQVIASGGEAIQLPIAPDEPAKLRELIARGLDSDLLLMSGGVSAGEYDLVEDALSDFTAQFFFTGVQIQPGKPLVFGRARGHGQAPEEKWTYFFGLPGNPISTMVTFELFASMMIRALSGASAQPVPWGKARLANRLKVNLGLTRFLPARFAGAWNDASVERVPWQGSGDIAAFALANCLLVVPPDRGEFEAGEMMTVVPLHD